ncbi:MAG: iron-containing alcohol dehydrogenase, partial [Actinobacteria bacterium]|nr:iron-containing alcohol dehydrogenase [Actinomycetota bacterium]
RTTNAVQEIAESLGDRCVGVSDEVGEHAPISNIIKAVHRVEETSADVIICVGGGSLTDFGKFVQLGVTVGAKTREELLEWRQINRADPKAPMQPPESFGPAKVRQIAVPTTFSTAEITPAGTPVDDVTGAKVLFSVRYGSPRAVVYDPDIVRFTPSALLAATGIRGFDHAVNNVISVSPNPLGSELSKRSIALFAEYLPRAAASGSDRVAIAQCQLASWMAAMANLAAPHGFSHTSVHVLAPWAKAGHSDAACVMLLAQARWFCQEPDEVMQSLSVLLGRPDDPFDEVVLDLLRSMNLPTSLRDLGVDHQQIPELAQLMLDHPSVTKNNRRPIATIDDLIAVLESVAK